MIYKMTLKDSADEMTFDLLEVPIVDKDIEGAVDNVTLDGNQYTDYLWLKKQFIQKWSLLCDDEYTRLRGFYTRQFENADVPSYRLYYGDDIISYGTVEGKRINFTITGIEASMALDTIKGGTEQTTYTGKNLLQAKMPTTTINGITCTNNGDGSYTLNGTATAGADFRINQSTAHGEDNLQNYDGTYTLSCDELQNSMQLIVMQNGTFSQILRMRNSNTPATATFTKNDCFIYVYVAQGKTLNNLRIHPMLEKSATATAYEPYVGGIPAPNPSYPQPISTVTGRQTITVIGKNLYDTATTIFSNPSKVDVQVDGDTLKMTALENTTSGDLFMRTPIPDGLLENGKTYTISCVLGSGASKKLRLQLRNRDGSNAGFSNGYSITYDDRYVLFVVENPFGAPNTLPVSAGTVCVISNIQVEEGGSETTFESFHEQEQEINLGKNLWDTTVENGFIDNSGTQQSSTNQMRTVGYIKLVPNTAYTFSNTNGLVVDRVCYYNGAKTFIERSAYINNKTFTTTSTNFQFARIVIRATNSGNISPSDLAEPQLEKGYDATDYSAYFEPIELCKIGAYQDRIYKDGEKWYLHKEVGKVVFNGSENWSLVNSGASNFYYNLPVFVTPKDQDIMPVSNYFIGTPITNGNTSVGLWITNAGTIRARKETEQTLADFKTWLGTALPSVYHVLATATDTEITDATLLAQLNHAYSLYIGENNILSVTPNLMPEIKIAYTEIFEKSTDIIPETAVRLTLADGGVINACGCRKDVQLTMRETIE